MLTPLPSFDPVALVAQCWDLTVLPERRLRTRLVAAVAMLMRRWAQPHAAVPRADRRGFQRFCDNPRVLADRLAARADAATAAAVATCPRVVFAHDTTEVDRVGRAEPADAGPLRSNAARGYLVHSAVAVDATTGSRLGVYDATAWTRSWRLRKADHKRRAPHAKESAKWRRGVTRVARKLRAAGWTGTAVHAFDREGDVHENFTAARRHRWAVIARAGQDRKVAGPHGTLWAHLAAQPVAATRTRDVPTRITVAARKAAAAAGPAAQRRFDRRVAALGTRRTARLELRYATVTLAPPARTQRRPVTLDAVWVREVDAPPEVEPLAWMLLTTCPVTDVATAWQVADDYALRWGSEDLHKVVKHGLHLEDTPVADVASFRRLLAVVLPLATHVLQWTYVAREQPRAPLAPHVTRDVLALVATASRYHRLPATTVPTTVGAFVTRLAQLGGYEVRPDRVPGWLVIWRGWQRLLAFGDVLEFAQQLKKPAPS